MKTPEELTQDWKEGKLKFGAYYVIYQHNKRIWLYRDRKQTPDNSPDILQILAPVPTYKEYKGMQEELAEHRENCCCLENEKLQLDNNKLEEEIANLRKWEKHTWDYDLQAERISELLTDNKKMQDQIADVSKKVEELCGMLKECLAHLSLGEIGTSVTPINILIDRINAALGESEDK